MTNRICDKETYKSLTEAKSHQIGLYKRSKCSTKAYICPHCGKVHVATIKR